MFPDLPAIDKETQDTMTQLCAYYRTPEWRAMIRKHYRNRLLREIKAAIEMHIENLGGNEECQ